MRRIERERSYSNILAEADESLKRTQVKGAERISNQTFELDQSDFELPLMEAIGAFFSWTTVK